MATQTPDEKQAREFQVKRSPKDGKFYWNAKSPANGKITLSGEGHPNAAKALRAIVQEMEAVGSTKPIVIHVEGGETVRYPAPVSCVEAAKPDDVTTATSSISSVSSSLPAAPAERKVPAKSITMAAGLEKVSKQAKTAVVPAPTTVKPTMPLVKPTVKPAPAPAPVSKAVNMNNQPVAAKKAPNLAKAIDKLVKAQPAAKAARKAVKK